jgi:hypothetical protein
MGCYEWVESSPIPPREPEPVGTLEADDVIGQLRGGRHRRSVPPRATGLRERIEAVATCAVVLVGVGLGLAQAATTPTAPTASAVASSSTLDPDALSIGMTKPVDTDSYARFCENNSDLCTISPQDGG